MGTLTIRLKSENREKLQSMASEAGVTPNRMVNLLIENAVIGDVVITRVVKREPVAHVPGVQRAVILPPVVRPDFHVDYEEDSDAD